MKLYCSPGGTWAGTEAAWKAAVKAEGIDPKTVDRKQVDVPVDKAGLMEFLTFHGVNPINPRAIPQVVGGATPLPPAPPVVAPETVTFPSQSVDLDALFQAAPLGQQLSLAAIACENGYRAAITKS